MPGSDKIAFLFPGQGSQAVGMGKKAFESSQQSRDVFAECDDALGFSLSKLCFDGPSSELSLTINTQPAILATSIALFGILDELGVKPDFVAGHSLGEYSAQIAAGGVSLRDAVTLVRNRGRYMQEAVPVGTGSMAAILGMCAEEVYEVCSDISDDGVVEPANLNGARQVVIAGHKAAVEKACELAKSRGARRILHLPVSAPFHCRLMKPAEVRLKTDLATVNFSRLTVPLVNNVDAKLIVDGEDSRDSLVRQVCSSVRWEESVQLLSKLGVQRFVEIGPGKVLSSLVRKIVSNADTMSVDCPESAERVSEACVV